MIKLYFIMKHSESLTTHRRVTWSYVTSSSGNLPTPPKLAVTAGSEVTLYQVELGDANCSNANNVSR